MKCHPGVTTEDWLNICQSIDKKIEELLKFKNK